MNCLVNLKRYLSLTTQEKFESKPANFGSTRIANFCYRLVAVLIGSLADLTDHHFLQIPMLGL